MAVFSAELPAMAGADLLAVFRDLAVPEGYRVELIEGEIVVSPPPDGDHEDIVAVINKRIVRGSAADVYVSGTVGLIMPLGRFIPDSVVGAEGLFRGRGHWSPPEGVLLVVEVTSLHPERDREAKRRGYAAAGISRYLLIDRTAGEAVLYSEPREGDYRADVRVPFGKPLDLPDPFGFTLDTTPFA